MSDPELKLTFGEDDGSSAPTPRPAPSAQRFDQLYGSLRIIDAEPTWTPRGRIEESIALLIDGGTPNLCVYDYQNRAWLFAELSGTRIP
jgi:hypothetical protein